MNLYENCDCIRSFPDCGAVEAKDSPWCKECRKCIQAGLDDKGDPYSLCKRRSATKFCHLHKGLSVIAAINAVPPKKIAQTAGQSYRWVTLKPFVRFTAMEGQTLRLKNNNSFRIKDLKNVIFQEPETGSEVRLSKHTTVQV